MARFALLLLLSGCVLPEPVEPPPPPPVTDAGACEADIGIDDCGRAQLNMWCELGCQDYRGSRGADRVWGTADDESFADICRRHGDFNPACLASASSCDDGDACAEGQ